jgi:hypothetical protein
LDLWVWPWNKIAVVPVEVSIFALAIESVANEKQCEVNADLLFFIVDGIIHLFLQVTQSMWSSTVMSWVSLGRTWERSSQTYGTETTKGSITTMHLRLQKHYICLPPPSFLI